MGWFENVPFSKLALDTGLYTMVHINLYGDSVLKNRSKYVHAFVQEYVNYMTGSSFLVETISGLAAIANVKSSLSVHGCIWLQL